MTRSPENFSGFAIKTIDCQDSDWKNQLSRFLRLRLKTDKKNVYSTVVNILSNIESEGDEALLKYIKELDDNSIPGMANVVIGKNDLEVSWNSLPDVVKKDLQVSNDRIRLFHEKQVLSKSWSHKDSMGNEMGQRVVPLNKVGLYVPGGLASYPSTVLMTAIPAKVAGVNEIVMATPNAMSEFAEPVLGAAWLAGVSRVFAMGGAHAIGAMAFGTESIPKVDKIVGPGNAYVTEAKKQVFGSTGIDMLAGPSEIMIVADDSLPPEMAAMDMFAQAEHDEAAQSILASSSSSYLEQVKAAVFKLLPGMKREGLIRKSLQSWGLFIKTGNSSDLIDVSNLVAPEHLQIVHKDCGEIEKNIVNAGAIFKGRASAEVFGDYLAGPSHVLPTTGSARFASPLNVSDFQKLISIIDMTADGSAILGPIVSRMARLEGLDAHSKSARMRFIDQ